MATPITYPLLTAQPGPIPVFNHISLVSKSIAICFASDKSGNLSGGTHSLGG